MDVPGWTPAKNDRCLIRISGPPLGCSKAIEGGSQKTIESAIQKRLKNVDASWVLLLALSSTLLSLLFGSPVANRV
jgi:hypothetical protein